MSPTGVSDSCARWLFHIGVSDRFVKIMVSMERLECWLVCPISVCQMGVSDIGVSDGGVSDIGVSDRGVRYMCVRYV